MPFEDDTEFVYVRIEIKVNSDEARLLQEIAEHMFKNSWVSLKVISENEG